MVIQPKPGSSYFVVKQQEAKNALILKDWFELLRNITEPIRDEIFSRNKMDRIYDLNPSEALELPKLGLLVSLICENTPCFSDLPKNINTICQLIIMNTIKRGNINRPDRQRRIAESSQVPVSRYISIKLFSIIRSKALLQMLFHLGIGISYHSILSFIDNLTTIVLDFYSMSGNRVMPTNSVSGCFSVMIDDNIDVNSCSPTATKHFHGTSITLLQFPTETSPGSVKEKQKLIDISDRQGIDDSIALKRYLNIQTYLSSAQKVYSPLQLVNNDMVFEAEVTVCFDQGKAEELDWGYLVASKIRLQQTPVITSSTDEAASWTAHHLLKSRRMHDPKKTVNCMLPVIDHVVHEKALQLHLMNITLDYTEYLNPGQTAVSCGDQPLYALKKQILWECPNQFKKQDIHKGIMFQTYSASIFPFFGPMHLEMNVLSCHGKLVKGTGLEEIFKTSGLKTVGLTTALCEANSLKKARYTVQITTAVLCALLKDAFENCENSNAISMNQWVEESKKSSVSFKYWFNVLEYELNIHLFIRSLRESNFKLFVGSLDKFCPMFFSLDHTHYARWVSVFVNDLMLLKNKDIVLFEEFLSGKFAMQYSNSNFATVGYDQAHEMNNKILKSKSGFGDLFNQENTGFLKKLEITSPEISHYLSVVEGKAKATRKHKEEMQSFSLQYLKDCKSVYQNVATNPFVESDLKKLNTSFIFLKNVADSMSKAFSVGIDQYNNFKMDRFVKCKVDVMDKIPNNSLLLPAVQMKPKDCLTIVTKMSAGDMVRLRSACIFRAVHSKDLFRYEFTGMFRRKS